MAAPIAIIGAAVRLPGGVNSLDDLWALLRDHRDAVTETAHLRWDSRFFHPRPDQSVPGRSMGRNRIQRRLAREHPGTIYTKAGGFLPEIDQFDAEFFGIGPREASRVDPQHRMLLELAWEAIENGGQRPESLAGHQVGVFVGISSNEYITLQYDDPGTVNAYTNSGGAFCMAANRLSYFFGFRGPSLSLDTACSSALVALHLACRSLWAGESSLALAGGANCLVKPAVSIGLCQASMLSPTGRCHSFDAAADGYVRAEGGGLFLLKPLAQAQADGDPIHAVIRASGVNQDGRTLGISLPSEEAQESLLRAVYQQAGIDPAGITYVEAHGTGTPAGDPIECRALGRVVGANRSPNAPCYIGSVKSNLGHLEPASGAAGLAKLLVCLKHRSIPANLHFSTPNPAIPFADLGLKVVAEDLALPETPAPLLVGINSFGFGGTNAHLIVEEYRAPSVVPAPVDTAAPAPLLLSARGEAALRDLARAYIDLLRQPDAPPLADIACTAALRRGHHTHRLAVHGRTAEEVAGRLETFLEAGTGPHLAVGRPENPLPKKAFVFSGNGTQWWAMGRQLLAGDVLFRDTVREVDAALAPLAGWSLMEELLCEESHSRMARTEVAQPALFALQAALCAWLRHRGIVPDAVVGHSVGEVAAAYTAGVLSLHQALRLVVARSRVQEATAGQGAMGAASLSPQSAEEYLRPFAGRLELVGLNAPGAVTVSGDVAAIDEFVSMLRDRGIFAQRLALDYPFHSYFLDGKEPEFSTLLGPLQPAAGQVKFASTVTGRIEPGGNLDAGYWWRNIRQPVCFRAAVDALIADGVRVFVEVGSHPALGPYVAECAREAGVDCIHIPTLNRRVTDQDSLLDVVGRLYTLGLLPSFDALFDGRRRYVELPRYPWQRERYWNSPREGAVSTAVGRADHPLLGYAQPGADPSWQGSLELQFLPYLADHVVQGATVFPAAAYLEMALWAGKSVARHLPVEIEEFDIWRPLTLPENHPVPLQLSVSADDGTFKIRSKVRGQQDIWSLHASGRLATPSDPSPVSLVTLDTLRQSCPRLIAAEQIYAQAAERGLEYGPAFQGMECVWAGSGEALGRIGQEVWAAPESAEYLFYPPALDACLQVLLGLAGSGPDASPRLFVPVHVDRARLFGPPRDLAWCHVRVRSASPRSILADFKLLDATGAVLATLSGFRFRAIDASRTEPESATCYEHTWLAQPLPQSAVDDDAPTRTYLILSESPVGDELARRLDACGSHVVTAPPAGAAALRSLFETLTELGRECRGIVYLLGSWEGALHLIQAAQDLAWTALPELWLVTAGAWAGDPWQAPLWGIGRVAANEHPELHCRMVDLGSVDDPAHTAELLLQELQHPGDEDEIRLDTSGRYVTRFSAVTLKELFLRQDRRSPETSFRLVCGTPGSLDSLTLQRMPAPRPGPGQVQVRVRAAGLNFRDVMWAMGMLPPEALEGGFAGVSLGIECAGEIEAVGEGVTDFQVGDRVLAFGTDCFATSVVTDAAAVARMPGGLSFEEGATIPTVFMTAYYALVHLARLQPGERVLIHGAAGGVGLAAIQIARLCGAEIFATAGNDEKREFLRRLGVIHVFDSRSLAFADQILETTAGEGVDVVLNSLSGEAIEKSLRLLRPFGRFLEIGKRDLYANSRIGLRPFRNNLSYLAVDADQLLVRQLPLAAQLFRDLLGLFERQTLRPLVHQVFPVSHAREAFRTMQQSRHIGKIVLSMDATGAAVEPAVPAPLQLRQDGAYLVSGGLAGFGLTTAEWLAAKGARHLVLIGRRGAATPDCGDALARIDETGARVQVAAIDVTDDASVAALFAGLRAEGIPVRGIVHAAAVYDDNRILDLDATRFHRVLDPKVHGAWNLHLQSLASPLDFFVLYSSVAALAGNAYQASYAAANLFLESLARHRRARSLPALAVSWGAIDEVGYLARNPAIRKLLEVGAGVSAIPPARALAFLEQLLLAEAGEVCFASLQWSKWRQNAPGSALPKYALLLSAGDSDDTRAEGGAPLRALLAGLPPPEQRALVLVRLAGHLSRILGLPPGKLDPQRSLSSLGLDSLMAAELHTLIESETGLDLPMMRLLQDGTVAGLAEQVWKEMAR